MGQIRVLVVSCMLLVFSLPLRSEYHQFDDFTTPGVMTPDLVIIGGDLDLKDSFTVQGDLKIIDGKVSLVSDNILATTVDLHVHGDLFVTNMLAAGDATINIPHGRLFVAGEIFTYSEDGDAWILGGSGIQAGRIETAAADDAYIKTYSGSITVEGGIVTSAGADGYVDAGSQGISPTVSLDLVAASVSVNAGSGDPTGAASIMAGGSVLVNGPIFARGERGDTSLTCAYNFDGGIEAGSIHLSAVGDTMITDDGGFNAYLDVRGDVVSTSSSAGGFSGGYADIDFSSGYVKAGNIALSGYRGASIDAQDYIDVAGDIKTRGMAPKSLFGANAYVYVNSGYLKAGSVTTYGSDDAYVEADSIEVAGEINTSSISDPLFGTVEAYVLSNDGGISAGSIKTYCDVSDGHVEGDWIDVVGDIRTNARNFANIFAFDFIKAENIYTNTLSTYDGGNGQADVQCSLGYISVQDVIGLRGFDAYLSAQGDINARSIITRGDSDPLGGGGPGYVASSQGDITVVEDIDTEGLANAEITANNGSIYAQKIKVPNGNNVTQAVSGNANFELVLDESIDNNNLTDCEFSFDRDRVLDGILYFSGDNIINGRGHHLSFDDAAQFIVLPNASLTLRNIELKNVDGNDIRCSSDTGTISFENVTLWMDDDVSFQNGSMNLLGDLTLRGTERVFSYESSQPCVISSNATLFVDRSATFKYDTGDEGRLQMTDETSRIHLDGSVLQATQDLRLTKGTLLADNRVTCSAEVGTTIYFGDGSTANNLNFEWGEMAKLKLAGDVQYANA